MAVNDRFVNQVVTGPCYFYIKFTNDPKYYTLGTCETTPIVSNLEQWYNFNSGPAEAPLIDRVYMGAQVQISGIFNNVDDSILRRMRDVGGRSGNETISTNRRQGIWQRLDIGRLLIRGGLCFQVVIVFLNAEVERLIDEDFPQGYTYYACTLEGDKWNNMTTVPRDEEITFTAWPIFVYVSGNAGFSQSNPQSPVIKQIEAIQSPQPGTWILYTDTIPEELIPPAV